MPTSEERSGTAKIPTAVGARMWTLRSGWEVPKSVIQVMMGSVNRCVYRSLPTIVALRFTLGTQLHRQLMPHAAK